MKRTEQTMTAAQIARKRERTRQWRIDNPERNRAHSRASYYRRREKCIAQVTAYVAKNRTAVYERRERLQLEKRQWLTAYKAERGCSRCPAHDPVCLDFHHRGGKGVDGRWVSRMSGWSLIRIQKEIAKCDVICSNCHRKLHAAKQSGMWRRKRK